MNSQIKGCRSAIIEFLDNDLPIPDTGLAFIYCDYKEYQSQTTKHFVGAIVRQLSTQRPAIPEEVCNLYEKHRTKGTSPSLAEYLMLLQSLAQGCSEVYLVIDALDECTDKDGTSIWSSLVTELKRSVPNLRLLCTSRTISDTRGSLRDSTHVEIRVSDADIRAYIQRQVESSDRLFGFCEQDGALRDEIVMAVESNTAGM